VDANQALLCVLYTIACPHAPEFPEDLLAVLDEAVERELATPNGRYLTAEGESVLRDGLQAIADTIEGVKAVTSLAGGVLGVQVTVSESVPESFVTAPAAWWKVHRAFFPITQHAFRIELV
jgi:hypothetical protein